MPQKHSKPTKGVTLTIGPRKGALKDIGGSQSDHWNNTLANQAVSSLWTVHSDDATLARQRNATVEALIGIGPKDELEGMIAAQLLAAHNAAMECYRRAMIGEQTFEGRRENLSQGSKLSRTCDSLLEALNRHRGKARTRSGKRCQSPAMPNGRCRMHGGPSPGAPKGNKNALKHGRYTAEAISNRRRILGQLRAAKALLRFTTGALG